MIDFMDLNPLRGKTVAIAGASSGIGRETALLLGRLKVNLVLGARRIEAAREAASAAGTDALVWPLDVTDETSVQAFADAAISRFGRVDALVNCAGTGSFQPFLETTLEEFDRMLSVNLKGTFLCCKSFVPHMLEHRSGKILNVASIAGTTALAGCAAYSASKFGVMGLTKVMQAELRGHGIQVTALLPGAVNTPFWESIGGEPARDQMIPVRAIANQIAFILGQPEGCAIDEIVVMPPLGIL